MRKPNHKKKSNYKGPYQDNPNLDIQKIRTSMRPEVEGPTVDTFSSIDSTTNVGVSESKINKQPIKRIKRPTKEKKNNFSISTENVVLTVIGFIAIGIGIIVYTHSNRFVSVEKDVQFIYDDSKELKEKLENVSKQTNEVDKKVDLLNQKIDLTYTKK